MERKAMVDKDSRLSIRRQCELLGGVARHRLKAKERQESAENSHRVLRAAVQQYGRPEIVNSDQAYFEEQNRSAHQGIGRRSPSTLYGRVA